MKILAVVSTIDLKYRLGCTPAWWQILKAMNEIGNEVLLTPYLGSAVESLWWRSYPNPWVLPGELYYYLSRKLANAGTGGTGKIRDGLVRRTAEGTILPIWSRHIRRILEREKEIDAVVFFNIPVNQIQGIPSEISREYGKTVAFYDGDMPGTLPENAYRRGFLFNYYVGTDLSEYDVFFVNSEGATQALERLGARRIRPLHYAADSDLFAPIGMTTAHDVAFFGYGSQQREEWMKKMIAEPSTVMPISFVVGGGGFRIDLGKSMLQGDVPLSEFRRFCCSATLNLNIVREVFARTPYSSTARPFELASLGCCVVSSPYRGIEKWFTPGKEIVLLSENDNVAEVYQGLLEDRDKALTIGKAARSRVIKEHTYRHRAADMTEELRKIGR